MSTKNMKPAAPTGTAENQPEKEAERFGPFPTPAKPEHLWERWSMANGNEQRANLLILYGWSLLKEVMEAMDRWAEVAMMLTFRGVAADESDTIRHLTAIDDTMLSIKDALFRIASSPTTPPPSPAGAPPPPSSPQETP